MKVDVERLRRLPLFGELDHHDLSMIAHHVGETEAPEGEVLFEQGSIPYEMFVIEEGAAEDFAGLLDLVLLQAGGLRGGGHLEILSGGATPPRRSMLSPNPAKSTAQGPGSVHARGGWRPLTRLCPAP